MITTANNKLLSTLALATALAVVSTVPAMAATDAPKAAASTPSATAKSTPTVDELVLVETIQLTPVNLASKLIGSAIHTADNKKVGDVKDLLIGENNKIVAVTVGVGGFLGIDETYLAFPMKDIGFSYDTGALRITTDLTKAAIEKAAKRK